MKKVILCTPRSGSTFATKWLLSQNGLPRIDKKDEPFTNKNPISFLEEERKRGIEYTYKVHVHEITEHFEWFKTFYNRDEVYILKRNLWDQYLSYLYQHENDWYLRHTDTSSKILNRAKESSNYKNVLQFLLKWYQWLDTLDYDILQYEDIQWEYCDSIKFSNHIDYEKYFLNIDDIREEYHQTIQS